MIFILNQTISSYLCATTGKKRVGISTKRRQRIKFHVVEFPTRRADVHNNWYRFLKYNCKNNIRKP